MSGVKRRLTRRTGSGDKCPSATRGRSVPREAIRTRSAYPRAPPRAYPAATHENPWRAPRLSYEAWSVMYLLLDRGGGLRIAQLLQASTLPDDALVAGVNELAERLWVKIEWRGPAAS